MRFFTKSKNSDEIMIKCHDTTRPTHPTPPQPSRTSARWQELSKPRGSLPGAKPRVSSLPRKLHA